MTEAGANSASTLVMVLLDEPASVTAEGLADAWSESWSSGPAPTNFEVREDNQGPGPATMTFDLDGLTVAMAMIPAPIPGGELDGPAATTWLWPGASAAMGRVGAHVVVWVSGPDAVQNHWAVTRVVSAVIRATGALGVYWGSAGLVISGEVFDGLAHEYVGGLPTMLWVDYRATVRRRRASLFTVGMADFGLMEIEIHRSKRKPGELREFVMGIAGYLIESGPVINDGDTVGGSEAEKIKVRYAPSEFD